MPKFTDSDRLQLVTCDMALRYLLEDAIKIVPFKILEGHRGQEAQEAAFVKGATKLHWPNGKHNASPSRAVDIAPVYYDNGVKIDWNDLVAFGRLMGVIQACAWGRMTPVRFGMDWDGDFRTAGRDPGETFLDAPHVELVTSEVVV